MWPQNFVRLKLQHVTRFSRHVWDPQKSVVKLRRVQSKLHRVQWKLRTMKNKYNRHKRLHLQLFVPLVHQEKTWNWWL